VVFIRDVTVNVVVVVVVVHESMKR